ncbi:MAG TPA: RNA methyltransferase [Solirubrobacterales bacterium]|nr:RNA methyltransferase [Solirubrobacterales bacterium]
MIESKDNEKLKLVRKLRERKHREREGLFATEGEDLLEAGLAEGAEPRFVLVAAGSGIDGEEVALELLASVSALGSGTRAIAVWPRPEPTAPQAPCVYLDGVGDPGNVGAIVRTAHALLDATVALGPECADPFWPKATRASMGSVFAHPPAMVSGVACCPEPRVALVAHGGGGLAALAGAATLCLGAERDGLRDEVLSACAASATIPLQGAVESLGVAAAAAVACARMSEERKGA